MRAMVLEQPGRELELLDIPDPEPGPGEIVVRVAACGVCHTDLHIVDGELPNPKLPLIPGHEVVGYVTKLGVGVTAFSIGERVGIPWLGSTCGRCRYCLAGRENLCESPGFTGYTINGGYAEYAAARADFCFPLPAGYGDAAAAPLLCAGLIGYRSLKLAGPGQVLGIYGFGAAAHIVAQVARFQGRRFYAFTRPGDTTAQQFARALGAEWAGGSDESPPRLLDIAIIFAPVGALVPAALATLARGGTVVCGGIHMSDIPCFPYDLLWHERVLRSVANLTREDAAEFLALAPQVPVETVVETLPLECANEALAKLREGRLTGAAVLLPRAFATPRPADARALIGTDMPSHPIDMSKELYRRLAI